eukprot:597789-Prymnesium_polylepis.1
MQASSCASNHCVTPKPPPSPPPAHTSPFNTLTVCRASGAPREQRAAARFVTLIGASPPRAHTPSSAHACGRRGACSRARTPDPCGVRCARFGRRCSNGV